ncbi:MAG: hypothetical protein ACI4II_05815 [Acutalibacteraceae bacterium]
MKRILAVLLSLAMAASFTGCKKSGDNDTSSNVSSSATGTDASNGDTESDEYDESDLDVNMDVETEEMTVYTQSSRDYYWTPFSDEETVVEYATDKSESTFFANMDTSMQIVPQKSGESTIIVVKNGGEKKKLQITVVDGEDPDYPPEKVDENVVVDKYSPENLEIPSTYYIKMSESYDGQKIYEYIVAKSKTEGSFKYMDILDETSNYTRYVNMEDKKVYEQDNSGDWGILDYGEEDYESEERMFTEDTYFFLNGFTEHFYGFDDVAKYFVGKETVNNVECYVFEQTISDKHYYKYYVDPNTNVTLKSVERVPYYDGDYVLEASSYVEFLDYVPTNADLKP